MDLLVVSRNLPPLRGGIERVMQHAANALGQDWQVTVIGPRGCRAFLPAAARVFELPAPVALFLPAALGLVLALRLGRRFAVCVGGNGLMVPVVALAGLVHGCRRALFVHGLDLTAPHALYQRVFVPLIRRMDRLIANSRVTAGLATAAGVAPERVTILSPGVELPAAAATGPRPGLLSVGRLVARKGLAEFIRQALPRICAALPEVTFDIVGEEPGAAAAAQAGERARIESAIAQAGLDGKVVLRGAVDDAALARAYGAAAVLVEAAAHGVPSVAFDAGGVGDAVSADSGVLVRPGDYAAFADAVIALLRRNTRITSQSCMRHAARFAWSRHGAELRRIVAALSPAPARAPTPTPAPGAAAAPDYQAGFTQLYPEAAADRAGRLRKAVTMHRVLEEFLGPRFAQARVLDLGASTGIIAGHFARHVAEVVGVDIDAPAIAQAAAAGSAAHFAVASGSALPFPDGRFDAVLCAHVYEHVPDAGQLMREIRRVLTPGGVCYFAAGNRFQLMEPHYRLPLLSWFPRRLADVYLRVLGRGQRYYEKHLALGGLRRLAAGFRIHDATVRMIVDPERYQLGYLLPPGSLKAAAARAIARRAYGLVPTYIWLLEKPASQDSSFAAPSAQVASAP